MFCFIIRITNENKTKNERYCEYEILLFIDLILTKYVSFYTPAPAKLMFNYNCVPIDL